MPSLPKWRRGTVGSGRSFAAGRRTTPFAERERGERKLLAPPKKRWASSLPQCCLSRGQAGDRHTERTATDVIQTDLVAELDRVRIAAVLAANANLQIAACGPALLDA